MPSFYLNTPPIASALAVPLDAMTTIIASSASGHVARHALLPSVLRAEPRTFQTNADAKTTPPSTWTAQNSANMAAASVTAGVLSIEASTGSTYTHNASTNTGGGFYRDITARRQRLMGARMRCRSANQDFEVAAMHVSLAATPTTTIGTQIGYSGGQVIAFRSGSSDVGSRISISADQWVWVGFLIEGTTVTFLYSTATTKPSTLADWTIHSTTSSLSGASTASVRFSLEVGRAGTPSGAFYAEYEGVFDDEVNGDVASSSVRGPDVRLGGEGYPTTSDSVTLIASADLTNPGIPSIALVRAMLADAENRLPGDAATWTWSLTGSASASPAAATTYQSAASLNLKDAGTDTTTTTRYRYWSLRAKYASAGNVQPGSLDLGRIPGLPVT